MPSKRERYQTANTRGGLGVRKRLSEESLRDSYRLNGVQTGSVVVRAHDKYYGDFTKGFDVGVLVRKKGNTVTIHWHGDEDATHYNQGDARYEVERGRWKFLGIIQGNPLDPTNPMADALTALRQNAKMGMSGDSDTPPTEETEDMKQSKAAEERAAAQKQLKTGELKERETYTAKQIATRCGTDSKTMRKFFRSNHSTVEPVGQGGRYEFDANDFPKIKREFDAWQKKARDRKPAPKVEPETVPITEVMDKAKEEYTKGKPSVMRQQAEAEQAEVDRIARAAAREEPTDEELADIDEDELDMDDLPEMTERLTRAEMEEF